ncbi:MAG: DUF1289 domain-containing protein [Amylibacter sp.]|nr:DUF1289 domain-containing protein [Amylibacter sp.]
MDEIWKRNEPDSPCVKVCVIHPKAGICIGCYRRNGEIAAWARMERAERLAIIAELPERAGLLKGKRKGGRKGD